MKKGVLPRTPAKQKTAATRDSLQVYCRLKPMFLPTDISCIKVISDTTVQLRSPETAVNFRSGIYKETQYSFKRVFTDSDDQKLVFDEVALPLVEQLIRGNNGLLFTYGVTGSGKTYTMTGATKDGGIMPRCLDVIFNSIADYQAKRYIFKPDKMNGFEVQTEEEARREEAEIANRMLKIVKLRKKDSEEDIPSSITSRSKDVTCVQSVEEDNAYAVFVTYIEIYNNSVYDLLENISDLDVCSKLQVKIVREDASHNMYVHGVTEVEVKDANEAFEVFYKGQKRKRMAHTTLNTESSRSHSVFTIRLVQAPLDPNGEQVMQNKKLISISQLSLVDLAGSERTNRTKNCGQRLREAGNINNSLMTLRNCLEILRENQITGGNKIIPYRESKLTHLFKNYFDGDGDIRMIVCVNPRDEDYDETVQVMKFAEVSQEIQITKSTPMKQPDVALTPGRRRLNQFRKALVVIEEENKNSGDKDSVSGYVPDDLGIIYSFPPLPSLEIVDENDESTNQQLIQILEERLKKREALYEDINRRADKFRASLVNVEQNHNYLQQELNAYKAMREQDSNKTKSMSAKIVSLESSVSNLKRKCDSLEEDRKKQKIELEHKDIIINQMKSELDHMKRAHKKVKPLPKAEQPEKENKGEFCAVSNPRYRRSRSVSDERWLHHSPLQPVPLNTVFQPVMKRRRSFTSMTSPEQVKEMSKYCLMTQIQDAGGELETKLVKGDVIPTAGGGAQVVFNDVETLKQTSPTASTSVKRLVDNYNGGRPAKRLYPDVSNRCAISIEGHSSKK